MALTTNRELTNEIALPMKFIPDVKPTDFTLEKTQAIKTSNLNCILNNKFACLILRTRRWKLISRMSTIIGERTRNIWTFKQKKQSPGNLQLMEKRQEDTKSENLGKNQNDRLF